MSLIATLREEARLPLRTIQWYLDTVHGLHLSRGAIVDAIRKVAGQAQGMVADILEQVRASPVVYADETGWREDGHNGCVWIFSTPDQRYFLRRNRGKAVVDEVLGNEFAGVLVSDFYAAYHHCRLPPLRRPQATLLGPPAARHPRPASTLPMRARYPNDGPLAQWADAVHQLYRQATTFTLPAEKRRHTAKLALERRLLALCRLFPG